MAGDWIKMSTDLRTHPKVVRIASALKADRLRVVGGLHAVWCLFDAHSADGSLEGYTLEALDDLIGWPGFSAAMVTVDWMSESAQGLDLPRFEDHNGQSAKRRAQETERKRMARAEAELSAADADTKRTREEKRREEEKKEKPPIPPKGGKPAAVSLKTWIDEAKANGERVLPDGDPVFAYAEEVGIPHDFLHLAWTEFRHRYTEPGAKRYCDWRSVFRKAVRGNWLKLWWLDGENYTLTTVGQQAKRARDGKEAA